LGALIEEKGCGGPGSNDTGTGCEKDSSVVAVQCEWNEFWYKM